MSDVFDEENMLRLESSKDSEEEAADRLIFPVNVYDIIAGSRGISQGDKRGIAVTFWVALSLVAGWVLLNFLRQFTEYYIPLTVLIMVVAELLIGSFILTYVLDLGTLNKEQDKSDNSFSQYFSIARTILTSQDKTYPFDVIEFADGTHAAYIQFRMGYNTEHLSQATYQLNRDIIKMINSSFLLYRKYYTSENFKTSIAAEELMDGVKAVKDETLFIAYREIIQNLLNIAADESNVPMLTIMICAKTRIQKEELAPLVTKIIHLLEVEESAYRSVKVLSAEECVSFYQEYTKLKVMDMGQVRAKAGRMASATKLSILKIYGDKGIYTTPEFAKVPEQLLHNFGLEEVK